MKKTLLAFAAFCGIIVLLDVITNRPAIEHIAHAFYRLACNFLLNFGGVLLVIAVLIFMAKKPKGE